MTENILFSGFGTLALINYVAFVSAKGLSDQIFMRKAD